MMAWAEFWKWTLMISVAIFMVLVVVVTIGGAYDIRAMFKSIREQHEQRDSTDGE